MVNHEEDQEDDSERYASWDAGCLNDPIRNGILVPAIIDLVTTMRPARILDVGCATGYVPRKVSESLAYSPQWTLLDRNKAALEFAASTVPVGMEVQFENRDIFDLKGGYRFDLVLMTFTLLEEVRREAIFPALRRQLEPRGSLILALPDCLMDILDEAEEGQNLEVLQRYTRGLVELEKVDKFTKARYPFLAERIEIVLERATKAGLTLVSIRREESADSAVFLMTFESRAEDE